MFAVVVYFTTLLAGALIAAGLLLSGDAPRSKARAIHRVVKTRRKRAA